MSSIPKSIPSVNMVSDRQTRDVLAALKQNVETLYGIRGVGKGALLTEDMVRLGLIGLKNGVAYVPKSSSAPASTESTGGTSSSYLWRITYNWADGSNGVVATHNLGFNLPKGYRITRSWFEVTEAFASGGSAEVSLGLGANDVAILGATAVGSLGTGLHDGLQTGAVGAFSALTTASSEVTLSVAVADLAAGKLTLVLEYMQIA